MRNVVVKYSCFNKMTYSFFISPWTWRLWSEFKISVSFIMPWIDTCQLFFQKSVFRLQTLKIYLVYDDLVTAVHAAIINPFSPAYEWGVFRMKHNNCSCIWTIVFILLCFPCFLTMKWQIQFKLILLLHQALYGTDSDYWAWWDFALAYYLVC